MEKPGNFAPADLYFLSMTELHLKECQMDDAQTKVEKSFTT